MDELRGMVVERRTDGGQGDMRRGVCTSMCLEDEQKHRGIHTHLNNSEHISLPGQVSTDNIV